MHLYAHIHTHTHTAIGVGATHDLQTNLKKKKVIHLSSPCIKTTTTPFLCAYVFVSLQFDTLLNECVCVANPAFLRRA